MIKHYAIDIAALALCLAVVGCGGGGGGEPTVTQTVHDELQAELDAVLADLAEEREAKAKERTARTVAETEVARLEGVIGSADDAADAAGSLYAQLNAATGNVTALEAEIGAEADEADVDGSLYARLNAAKADVTRLEGVIGTATDTASAATTASLHAQLNASKAEVMRLEGVIGATGDTANAAATASLHAQLNASKAEVMRLEGVIGATGDTANAAATASLHAQLNAAKAQVRTLTAEIGTTGDATSLKGQLDAAKTKANRLEVELAAANTSLTTLRGQLTTAQQQAATAQQQAATARQEAATATQQAQQRASNLEANQRAQNLKLAFTGGDFDPDGDDPFPDISITNSPVTVTVPTRGSLRLVRGGHTATTLSGAGLRSKTMALTSGADSGKTVVYTDRELSRSLLEHFGQQRDVVNGIVSNRFDLDEAPIAITGGLITYVARPQVTTQWRVTHGVRTSLTGVLMDHDDDPLTPNVRVRPADPADPEPRTSYAGHLYGISGNFVCGGTNCQIQLAPTYAGSEDDEGNSFPLGSVTLTNTVSGSPLFFQPSSPTATIPLYQGGPVGPDAEYMVFGFWREDPTSVAAAYEVDVFAQAFNNATNSQALSGTITATYDGTAVGMYVEQDPTNPVDTHRQGEFVADVDLRLNGTPDDAETQTVLTGTVDDFVTTPTGNSAPPRTADRWVVSLNGAGDVDIGTLAGTTMGNWEHTYVRAHRYAAMADGTADPTPPAVTGTFNASIEDFVHILGAFGVEKR